MSEKKLRRKQRILTVIGRMLTGIFAFSGGALGAVSLLSLFALLHIASGGITTLIIVGVVSVFLIYANYSRLSPLLSSIFVEMFDNYDFFKNLFKTTENKPFKLIKKIAMGFILVAGLLVGLTSGALFYNATFMLLSMLPLGAAAFVIPVIAAALSVTAFICISAFMLKFLVKVVQTENLWTKCKNTLWNLIDTDPSLARHQNKSRFRIILERALTVSLLTALLPLSLLGLLLTVYPSTRGLGDILLKIPGAIPQIVDISSKLIGFGISFLVQIPPTLTGLFTGVKNIFEKSEPDIEHKNIFENILYQFSRVISSLINGIITVYGTNGNLTLTVLGGAGGFSNTFMTMSRNNPVNQPNPQPETAEALPELSSPPIATPKQTADPFMKSLQRALTRINSGPTKPFPTAAAHSANTSESEPQVTPSATR